MGAVEPAPVALVRTEGDTPTGSIGLIADAPAPAASAAPDGPTPQVEETLVEEVSIDGMCGVY